MTLQTLESIPVSDSTIDYGSLEAEIVIPNEGWDSDSALSSIDQNQSDAILMKNSTTSNILNKISRVARWTAVAASASFSVNNLALPLLLSNVALQESFLIFSEKRAEQILNAEFSPKLLSLFKEKAIEDGEYHQAENVILQVLSSDEKNGWSLIQSFFYNNFEEKPSVSADFLQCISRLPNKYFDIKMITLAISALKNKDIEVRESGIRILESYKTEDSIKILKEYVQNESVDWLKEYAEQVVIDLS